MYKAKALGKILTSSPMLITVMHTARLSFSSSRNEARSSFCMSDSAILFVEHFADDGSISIVHRALPFFLISNIEPLGNGRMHDVDRCAKILLSRSRSDTSRRSETAIEVNSINRSTSLFRSDVLPHTIEKVDPFDRKFMRGIISRFRRWWLYRACWPPFVLLHYLMRMGARTACGAGG